MPPNAEAAPAEERSGAAESYQSPLTMSAEGVDAYFRARLGPPEDAFKVMGNMRVEELEAIQGVADDVSKGGKDQTAKTTALEWSTLISTFIA
mmetsp:Transcript_4232/g.11935  ORF Transcript_4232/g.11935 Transcript_4232/m.11935 type:complete len:93 (+) Transcript_4232:29-307(+)